MRSRGTNSTDPSGSKRWVGETGFMKGPRGAGSSGEDHYSYSKSMGETGLFSSDKYINIFF